jgi:transcriptional regulator with XRE-family HTH domain
MKKTTKINYRAHIGQQIAGARTSRGLTQAQLSDATGIDQSDISRIEGGKYNIGIDLLSRIAEALECRIDFHAKPQP